MWFSQFFGFPLAITEPGKLTKAKLARFKNNFIFQNTFSRLYLDLLNRLTIEGAPDTISERVFFQSLIYYGTACIFEKADNLLALPGAPDASFNVYGDAGSAFVFGANGFNERIKLIIPGGEDSRFLESELVGNRPGGPSTGVLIRDNAIMFPMVNLVMQFSADIADTMRTIEVCRHNLKTPFIVTAEESIIPTIRAFFKARDDNQEIILSSGIFDPSKISVIPIQQTADVLTEATQLCEWYEQKFREICGIESNSQIDKKGENLIEAELSINDEYEDLSLSKRIDSINEGLDLVNKVFGTNMKCRAKEAPGDDLQRDDTDRESDIPGDDNGRSEKSDL